MARWCFMLVNTHSDDNCSEPAQTCLSAETKLVCGGRELQAHNLLLQCTATNDLYIVLMKCDSSCMIFSFFSLAQTIILCVGLQDHSFFEQSHLLIFSHQLRVK